MLILVLDNSENNIFYFVNICDEQVTVEKQTVSILQEQISTEK